MDYGYTHLRKPGKIRGKNRFRSWICLDKGKKGKESLDFLGKFCERKKPPLKGFFFLLFLFGI